jgi:membrane peptidoglycan carboxypeptidase
MRKKRRLKIFRCAILFLACLALLAFCWAECIVGSYLSARGLDHLVHGSEISKPMVLATVAMEDGKFYLHHGFDFDALWHAVQVNLARRKVVLGGSTITQQLAKNLFLEHDRTVMRKVKEAFLTMVLERRLTKSQILKLYTNSIDYGMGNSGIRNAALSYFKKEPSQLSLGEAATIVGIVPDPPKFSLKKERLARGRDTALSRITFFFPHIFSKSELDQAKHTMIASAQ